MKLNKARRIIPNFEYMRQVLILGRIRFLWYCSILALSKGFRGYQSSPPPDQIILTPKHRNTYHTATITYETDNSNANPPPFRDDSPCIYL
jgi:hypothetical protein